MPNIKFEQERSQTNACKVFDEPEAVPASLQEEVTTKAKEVIAFVLAKIHSVLVIMHTHSRRKHGIRGNRKVSTTARILFASSEEEGANIDDDNELAAG